MAPFKSPYPAFQVAEESFATFALNRNSYPPDAPAYIDGISGETVTRATHIERAWKWAYGFRNLEAIGLLGLRRGSTVLLYSYNSVIYPALPIALGLAGIVPAFANASYGAEELSHAVHVSNSSHIVVHPPGLPTAVRCLALAGVSECEAKRRIIVMARTRDTPEPLLQQGWMTLDDLVPNKEILLPEKFDGRDAQETAEIFFSSGTTGLSKAIMVSHTNINSVLMQLLTDTPFFDYGKDVVLGITPFFHIMGSQVVALHSWIRGAPVVVLPRFEPKSCLAAIQRFKVTNLPLVPPLLTFLAKSPLVDHYDISSVKNVTSGAAPISHDMYDKCNERFARRGLRLFNGAGYGLTETSGIVSRISHDAFMRHPGSVGVLVSNMTGRVVSEDGLDAPDGEPGELWLRGPNIVKGYVGNPEANQETFTPDGWLRTGDIVKRNAEGFLWIVDRKKEFIKYKGFQVAPAELEALLLRHPGVDDAGVVGIWSEEQGTELPKAYIVPKDRNILKDPSRAQQLAQAIAAWLKDQVAHYKLLRGEIEFVASIPRSAAGKILRKDLRAIEKTGDMKAKL